MSIEQTKGSIKAINKGEIALLKIQLEGNKRNYIISRPTTEVRYDLVIDTGRKLYRTQVKYLNRKHGKNNLELIVGDRRKDKTKTYTKEEIDILLIYVPKFDVILILKPNQFHNKKTIHFNLINPAAKTYYQKFLW